MLVIDLVQGKYEAFDAVKDVLIRGRRKGAQVVLEPVRAASVLFGSDSGQSLAAHI
jgi:hypothetical protein